MDSQLAPSNPPLIDFSSENLKPGTSIWISTSKQVKCSLENHGIFLVTHDKISSEVKNCFYQAVKEFYGLPTEKKCQFTSDKPYSGYLGKAADEFPSFETTCIEDPASEEAFDGFINLFCSSGRKDYVSEIMQSYSKQVAELHEVIIRMVFESYGVEKYYESFRESIAYVCRVNKYRAATKFTEKYVGLVAHTDLSFMTILHQNQVNGLEVRSNDGSWIPVDFPPSSFAVVAGDALMAWSNGRIHSIHHRVMMASEEPRYSILLFAYKKGMVEPPEELVDEQHPLLFKPFDNLDLVSLAYTERVIVTEDKLKVLLALKDTICPS
ncbi:probable 2-oxoglutarate-dependent dioxygenase AOP1 [Coffea eugenioides]|uniref:probable 2-oxoglutarate-dependent dioxygenase AOP1 n=1 Tax=Coffea eugenioides TaxID=49369 RepID=UPI000F6148AE|nr:probable 2-oxoglutarate-dependent dioxygenase AOP1 [Coffea eugenioides]